MTSTQSQSEVTNVQVKKLNNLLVKVFFKVNDQEINFRAMVSEQKEGTLLLVQEKVAENYILSGVSGFLYKKPNIHGGYLDQLKSFYFHVVLDFFNGEQLELYFLGKEERFTGNPDMDLNQILTASQF